MPDRLHVHPDLVRPARLQPHLKQARRPERLQRVVMRYRRAPVGYDSEPAVAGRMPGDRRIDRAAERIGMALHEGVVSLVHLAVTEGLLEHAVGTLALGDYHRAGGPGVQPVHDALPFGRA